MDRYTAEYLRILPEMMDNPAVWEVIADRTPEQKDAFLKDRFDAAYQKCLKHRHDFDEWHEAAKGYGIEPLLAQTVWDLRPPLVIINNPPKLSHPCHHGHACSCGYKPTDK